jgi:hypothetical protein
MQFRFTQYLVAMRTAQRFLEEHDAQLGRVNRSNARTAFDESVARLADLAEAQRNHQAGITNSLAEERRALRRFKRQELQPLLTAMRDFAGRAPGIERPLRMGRHDSTTAVVMQARAVAQQAEAHRQFYLELGFDDDFLDRFRAATDQLVLLVAEKGNSRANRRQATLEIEQVLSLAKRTLRVLDGLVEKTIDDKEAPIRTGWRSAMAVVARRTRAKVEEVAPASPVLMAA